MNLRRSLPVALVLACACGSSDPDSSDPDAGTEVPVGEDWDRDILSTHLEIDVSTRDGLAIIELAASDSDAASFEAGDLEILAVRDDSGPLDYRREGEHLHVRVPTSGAPISISIEYRYSIHSEFEGAMASGVTLIWPYYCGNLFPCKSDPADGLTFELSVSGAASNEVAVFPASIPGEAPSYMIAWAVGDYTYDTLGETSAGTEVGTYTLPGDDASGADILVDAFDWLETTLGPYSFGDKVASVSAAWGPGAFGGMEHHPLWHVASVAMGDEETHAHEAAHGWFGNGIRIACWEDFVLSEGVVTYLAARIIHDVSGSFASGQTWNGYAARLDADIAWPDGCNEVDILADGLFGDAAYVKGAFFFRAVEKQVGAAALDAALSSFYAEHVGKAARMSDLIATIEAETGFDPMPCALAWLRSAEVPEIDTCPAT